MQSFTPYASHKGKSIVCLDLQGDDNDSYLTGGPQSRNSLPTVNVKKTMNPFIPLCSLNNNPELYEMYSL